MTIETQPGKRSLLRTGVILVVLSYVLLAPTFLFATLSIGGNTWLWARLAGGTYVLSWVLFIAGFLVAGPDAVRAGRDGVLKHFRRRKP